MSMSTENSSAELATRCLAAHQSLAGAIMFLQEDKVMNENDEFYDKNIEDIEEDYDDFPDYLHSYNSEIEF